ncbi:SCO family protein [Lysinibacillus sphaericus]
MSKLIFPLLFLLTVILTGCSMDEEKEYNMQGFTFTDQNGQSFGSRDLKGKIWVADFIFTNCDTVCPPMTASMAALQKEMETEGIDVQFVSFSADPEIDTPQRLKVFMKKFNGNEKNWHQLTGYTQQEIEVFAREEFQTLIQKPESSDQVIHSTSFYVIDQNGEVSNSFGFQRSHYAEIMREIKKLQ